MRKAEWTGIQLTSVCPTATDLRRSFMSGMPLAPKYAIIVVKEAIKVFSKEANVVRVAPPTPDNKLTIVGDLHGR